jgi:hypothetical protein
MIDTKKIIWPLLQELKSSMLRRDMEMQFHYRVRNAMIKHIKGLEVAINFMCMWRERGMDRKGFKEVPSKLEFEAKIASGQGEWCAGISFLGRNGVD